MLLKVGTVVVVATAGPGEDGLWEACYALHSDWLGLGESLLSCTVGGFDCERWALHFAAGEGVSRARCEPGCADAPVEVLSPD